MDPSRPRTIVRLAAKKVRDRQTKSWLTNDEKGAWERTAQDYLERTADKAKELGLTEDQVNEEIANELIITALTARIKAAQDRCKSPRPCPPAKS